MNEEMFKKVLYLIFKVLIKNNGFLSQLEIFKEVRRFLSCSFNLRETDLNVKLGQGKNEDFKEILNFILLILRELDLVSEKMENKSYYFKWNSMKGFYKKYINIINSKSDFEIKDSIDQRSQIYTRYIIVFLHQNKAGIKSKDIDALIDKCGLEGQYRNAEKIHSILCFINFINKLVSTSNSQHPFRLTTSNPGGLFFEAQNPPNSDQVLYVINEEVFNDKVFAPNKSDNELMELSNEFNSKILAKGAELGEKKMLIGDPKKDFSVMDVDASSPNQGDVQKEDNLGQKQETSLLKYRITIENYKNEYSDFGFALLRGTNWVYYIKKLHCIIGRIPMKHNKSSNYCNTTWDVDVDLGSGKKISKQHALIVYNFTVKKFEIKNLSKKFPIKVNGALMNYNEEVFLNNKSSIHIGNEEFYFLLPN